MAETQTDAAYFEPALEHRLLARAKHFARQIRALISFHSAYIDALKGADGEVRREALPMLDDLRGYCFADASTFDADPTRAAANVGRREVWLRIEAGLRLDRKKLETLKQRQEEQEDDE